MFNVSEVYIMSGENSLHIKESATQYQIVQYGRPNYCAIYRSPVNARRGQYDERFGEL